MIADLGSVGVNSIVSSGNTLSAVTNASITADDQIIMSLSFDNTGTSDGDHGEVASITDSSGTVIWQKCGEHTNGEGAAAAGVTASLWKRPRGTALASGATVLVTFSNTLTHRGCTMRAFSCDRELVVAAVVVNATDASNGFGSASISGLTSKEYLFFRTLAKEANVPTVNQITPSSGFTAANALRTANDPNAVLIRGEFRIATSTGETSDPTFAHSGDTAAVFVALMEAPQATIAVVGGGSVTLAAMSARNVGVAVVGGGSVTLTATSARTTSLGVVGGGQITLTTAGVHTAPLAVVGGGSVTLAAMSARNVGVAVVGGGQITLLTTLVPPVVVVVVEYRVDDRSLSRFNVTDHSMDTFRIQDQSRKRWSIMEES